MRGSPLIQAILLAAVLAAAGVPIGILTRPQPRPVPVVTTSKEETIVPAEFLLTTTAPAEVEMRQAGNVIWKGSVTERANFSVPLPPDAEVVTEIHWSSTGLQAVRFQVANDGDSLADRSVWGDRTATDVLSLGARTTP